MAGSAEAAILADIRTKMAALIREQQETNRLLLAIAVRQGAVAPPQQPRRW